MNEGIDATTAAGRLQMAVLAAIAAFERDRIVERVRAGLARSRHRERLGRPRATLDATAVARTAHLSVREAARVLGVTPALIQRHRRVPL